MENSIKQIKKIVDYWSFRLGIGDWKILFNCIPRHKMSVGFDAMASINTFPDHYSCHIELSLPSEWKGEKYDGFDLRDIEYLIVHEIVHGLLSSGELGNGDHPESSINRIAKALVSLHREVDLDKVKIDKILPFSAQRDPLRDPVWIDL